MTGDDDPDQHDAGSKTSPVARRRGATLGIRATGRAWGAVARFYAGGEPRAMRAKTHAEPPANPLGRPAVGIVAVEDLFMLAVSSGPKVNLRLPADPEFDPLAGFVKAAGASVDRGNLAESQPGGTFAVPVALAGSQAARDFPGIALEKVVRDLAASGTGILPLGLAARRVWRRDSGTGIDMSLPLSPVVVAMGKVLPPATPRSEIAAALEMAADAAEATPPPLPEPGPVSFRAYRFGMAGLALFSEPYLAWRARKGKEDPERKGERFGRAGQPRPQGRIGWVHAASVGESVSALPLIKRLLDDDIVEHLVVTTGTVTSAEIMASRLPARAIHQYAPLDSAAFVTAFIDTWRPDFAIFVESEIWPNFYAALKNRQIPIAIVNGRMSGPSFDRWRRHPEFIKSILTSTEICIAQTATYARRYAQLGAPNVAALGNIKFDSPPLPASQGELTRLEAMTQPRPVWLAASTHPGEEDLIADVHFSLRDRYPGLLTILVPRHPERGEEVATLLEDRWLATARRSMGAEPNASVDVYVADTIGELGLFYRLCPFAFIGGSLVEIGGHNPTEAANLDCAVLHGRHVQNFRDMFEIFDEAGAAIKVTDTGQLFAGVEQLITNPDKVKAMTDAGRDVLRLNLGALDRTMAALAPVFAARAARDD